MGVEVQLWWGALVSLYFGWGALERDPSQTWSVSPEDPVVLGLHRGWCSRHLAKHPRMSDTSSSSGCLLRERLKQAGLSALPCLPACCSQCPSFSRPGLLPLPKLVPALGIIPGSCLVFSRKLGVRLVWYVFDKDVFPSSRANKARKIAPQSVSQINFFVVHQSSSFVHFLHHVCASCGDVGA